MINRLSIIAALLCSIASRAATITSPDLIEANVQALINGGTVVNGDTVQLPSGTASWTANLIIGKYIQLIGAGTGATIIEDAIADRTGLIVFNGTAAGHASRLSNLTIKNHTGVEALGTFGVIQANGQGIVVIDNVFLNSLRGRNIVFTQGVIGLITHSEFAQWDTSIILEVYHNNWNGIGAYGDRSWAQPIQWGSTNAVYLQKSKIYHVGGTPNTAITDWQAGSRGVLRYNTVTNGVAHNHGTETNGRYRSALALEDYGNTFVSTTNFLSLNAQAFFCRGGTALVFSNSYSGYGVPVGAVYYPSRNIYWYSDGTNTSGANGRNNWHSNYVSGPFFTGTAAGSSSAGPNSTVVVQVSGSPGWTTNQWRGYTLMNTSVTGHNGDTHSYTHPFGEVITSGPDKLYYLCDLRPGSTNMSFTVGQNLRLDHVSAALDQPGAGPGTYISGDTPGFVNFSQTVEPIYIWDNVKDGVLNAGPVIDTYDYSVIVAGRNWTNIAKPGYTPLAYVHPLETAFGIGGCSYTLNAYAGSYSDSGGSGTITVTAGAGCAWTAVSNDGFIVVTGGSSGTGNGSVSYTVASNSGSGRSGTMTIAGSTFTISQSGASTSTTSTNVTASGSVNLKGGINLRAHP